MGKRISPNVIAKIQQDARNGVPTRDIAARYGVSKGAVSRALTKPAAPPPRPHTAPTGRPNASAPSEGGDDADELQSDAERLRSMISRDVARLEGPEGDDMPLGERVVLQKRLSDALGSLAKHAPPPAPGELTVEAIMSSPEWAAFTTDLFSRMPRGVVQAIGFALESMKAGPDTPELRAKRLKLIDDILIADLWRTSPEQLARELRRINDNRRRLLSAEDGQ